MSFRQPDLFEGDRWIPRRPKPKLMSDPRRSAPKPLAWEGMGSWVRQIGRLLALESCSSAHFRRFDETARQLTAERIRRCRHAEDLERVEERLLDARHQLRRGYIHDLDRVWTRAELGPLIVEVRNRIVQLSLGRDAVKPKGPRLDPARMPLDAIERLIQHHPDLELVERLRAERARRLDDRPRMDDTAGGPRP